MASIDARVGRSMFRGTTKATGVRDAEGVLRTSPSDMDQVLWDSRAAIWDCSSAPARRVGSPRFLFCLSAMSCPSGSSPHLEGHFGCSP
eukprot:13726962-Alexandrium_andersonii.AAC.1